MAGYELVAMDIATPQLKAIDGTGGVNGYVAPAYINITLGFNGAYTGYWFGVGNNGIAYQNSNTVDILCAGNTMIRFDYPNGIFRICRHLGWGSSANSSDAGIDRAAAKVLKITDGGSGAGVLQLPTFTVAGLPTVANAGVGARATVSDATVAYTGANIGSTVVGGGANTVPVMVIGANWVIGG